MITVNGANKPGYQNKTISTLLELEGYKPETVVVERNGHIVKRESYGSTVLRSGDTVEVVTFVGGG